MLPGIQTSIPAGDQARCRGCDHPRPPYTGGYTSIRSNLGTLLAKAEHAGCEICSVLAEGILQFLGSECSPLRREDVDEMLLDFNLAGSRRSVEVTFLPTTVKLSFFASKITPWLAENMPDLPLGEEVPPSTSSQASISWAIRQLQHCKETHVSCNSFPPAPLPSRVLDVFAQGGNCVRLYVSCGEKVSYAALSHCWGQRPFLRTMSGSIENHRNAIDWHRLPRTFQEAVEFTRKLGIRYLWIDSLCIIQDDIEDWRREASRMASVYQNAAVVISAAKAEGAYGGLYADLPATNKTFTIKFTPGARGMADDRTASGRQVPEQQIHVRRVLSHPHRVITPYHPSVTRLPIFTRGWVMQERFLSPRILHFGPEELSFECLESTTCQCTPSHHPQPQQPQEIQQQKEEVKQPSWYANFVDRTARPKHYYSLQHWQSSSDMTQADLETCWRRLVEDYSHLQLSRDADIFPAVSGLARQMRGVRADRRGGASGMGTGSGTEGVANHDDKGEGGCEYVAGLWTDTLLRGDLAWSVELPPRGFDEPEKRDRWGPAAVCRPREGWRAPSWSWASVRVPVKFIDKNNRIEPVTGCQVVEVRCEPVGPDPMGELKEGGSWLVLRSRLVPTGLRFTERKAGTEKLPWNVVNLDILDGGYLKNVLVDDDCQGLVTVNKTLPMAYLVLVGQGVPGEAWYFLLLIRVTKDESVEVRARAARGDGHIYRRIGLVDVFGGPPRPDRQGWINTLLEKGDDAVVTII
ncbi:hypothetical protein VTI28DRAFT_2292 [Corynascus sepedonium]